MEVCFAVRRDHDLPWGGGAAFVGLERDDVATARNRAHRAGALDRRAAEALAVTEWLELDEAVDRLFVDVAYDDVDHRVGARVPRDQETNQEAQSAQDGGDEASHETSPLFGTLGKLVESNFLVVVIGLRWLRLFDVFDVVCFNRGDAAGWIQVGKRRTRWNREPFFVFEET